MEKELITRQILDVQPIPFNGTDDWQRKFAVVCQVSGEVLYYSQYKTIESAQLTSHKHNFNLPLVDKIPKEEEEKLFFSMLQIATIDNSRYECHIDELDYSVVSDIYERSDFKIEDSLSLIAHPYHVKCMENQSKYIKKVDLPKLKIVTSHNCSKTKMYLCPNETLGSVIQDRENIRGMMIFDYYTTAVLQIDLRKQSIIKEPYKNIFMCESI